MRSPVLCPGSFIVSMAHRNRACALDSRRTFYRTPYTRDLAGNPIRPYDMSTATFVLVHGRSDSIRSARIPPAHLCQAPCTPSDDGHGGCKPRRTLRLYCRLTYSFPRPLPVLDKASRPPLAARTDGSVKSGDSCGLGDVSAIAHRRCGLFVASSHPYWRRLHPSQAARRDAAALWRRQHV